MPGTVARDDLGTRRAKQRQKPARDARSCWRAGRTQYDVFCSPCHDRVGTGNGIVVQRGFPQPASLHDERLRSADDQHLYRRDRATATARCTRYGDRVRPRDRWAIVAYIRALQLSQHAALADVPPDERTRLAAGEDAMTPTAATSLAGPRRGRLGSAAAIGLLARSEDRRWPAISPPGSRSARFRSARSACCSLPIWCAPAGRSELHEPLSRAALTMPVVAVLFHPGRSSASANSIRGRRTPARCQPSRPPISRRGFSCCAPLSISRSGPRSRCGRVRAYGNERR